MWMTWQIFLHRHLNPLTIIRIRINLWVNSNSIKDRQGLPIKNTLLFWLPIPDFPTSCSHEHWHICSQIMMLDTLDSLPRLRFSDAQMEVLMFAMRELGVRDVPSLRTFRRAQKKLRTEISLPSNRCESVRGNIFYVNDIATQVARVKNFLSVYHILLPNTTSYRTSQTHWSGPSSICILRELMDSWAKLTMQTSGRKRIHTIILLPWSLAEIISISMSMRWRSPARGSLLSHSSGYSSTGNYVETAGKCTKS